LSVVSCLFSPPVSQFPHLTEEFLIFAKGVNKFHRLNRYNYPANNYNNSSICVKKGLSMQLSPQEKDKLLIFTAALLAERRKNRGIKLNYPEAIAYIGNQPSSKALGKVVASLN
jgi:hypothetical protein